MSLEKVCAYCARPAKSGYVRYEDGTICCTSCKEYYPACTVCGKPAKQFVRQEGDLICSSCTATLARCSICQKVLVGKIYRFGEARTCQACFQAAEKCASCGTPLTKYYKVGQAKICLPCHDRLPTCSFCGSSILVRGWKNESEGILACAECYARVDHCAACGVPLKSPHTFQGRKLCARCAPARQAVRAKASRSAPVAVRASREKQYTFLVVNAANTIDLKREKEKDTLLVNNCLKNYHEYVKQQVTANRGIPVAFAEERILCLFDQAEDAVSAAEALVRGMESFNRQYNKTSIPLLIRLGLNSVEKAVTTEEGGIQVESLYGSVTDLAYKVEEAAEPGAILITEQTYRHLEKSKPRFAKHRSLSDLHYNIPLYRMSL